MSVTPRVSVVVPAGDDPAALRATVDEVLRQSETALELVVLGDGELDVVGTLAEHEDPRLLAIPCPGLGLGARLDAGFALARAPYVVVVRPGEASLARECLARQLAVLDANPASAAVLTGDASATAPAFLARVLEGDPPYAASIVVRARVVREAGGCDPTLSFAALEDLWLRALPGRALASLHEPLLQPIAAQPTCAAEGAAARAERAFVAQRAVLDDVVGWSELARRANPAPAVDGVDELAARLQRACLPELAPLVRALRRRSAAGGGSPPPTAQRTPMPSTAAPAAADEVRALAGLVRRAVLARRTLRDAGDVLQRATWRLAYDVAQLGATLDQAADAASAAHEKLRLGRRARALVRRLLGRTGGGAG